MTDIESLRTVFRNEAGEILAGLESDLLSLEERWDTDVLNRAFRYVHTLKGGAGMAGYGEVNEFTHAWENLLDIARSGGGGEKGRLISLLLEGMDWIRERIFEGDDAAADERKRMLLVRAEEYTGTTGVIAGRSAGIREDADASPIAPAGPEEAMRLYRIRAEFREDIFRHGIDPLGIVEDLRELGVVSGSGVDQSRLPSLPELDPETCHLAWELTLETARSRKEIEDVFVFVRDDNDVRIEDLAESRIPAAGKNGLSVRPIGEILLEQGAITENELMDVLSRQDKNDKRIGDIVVEKGYATRSEVSAALNEQEGVRRVLETSTVRVDASKLDGLLNLLGEIVIGQSGISRIADELGHEAGFSLKNALYGFDRVIREFQEQILSIRMIPIGPTFERFRRFVRDQARQSGKKIRLEIEGGETDLDKTVVERIGDPLKHMIRNAIDHGIEGSEERIAAGKPETGEILLRAYHQQGNVFIEVADDGRGVNRDGLRIKAESMGLLRPGEEASDQRLFSFLFLPGFSTAEKVGALSGRGVGMDVVKTNIESLRGSVEIESMAGRGTRMRMSLPLTLAIIEGMLVRVGANIYVLPLLSIVESVQPGKEEVGTVAGKGEMLLVRGEYVPLVRLYEFFGTVSDFSNPWESLVVIVETGNSRVGIMIDELVEQQQIVIKSIESYITRSRAISGAAILGDGRVALIIDVHGLVEELVK